MEELQDKPKINIELSSTVNIRLQKTSFRSHMTIYSAFKNEPNK